MSGWRLVMLPLRYLGESWRVLVPTYVLAGPVTYTEGTPVRVYVREDEYNSVQQEVRWAYVRGRYPGHVLEVGRANL